ncbi:TonB-dependent receptor [Mucilaginibacter sp. UYCu711]|uniref:TonB-dependent receptor n=1 Tax=Mucilaginibacter sp. UYCu711 TaxID=3156339 RepID=UPI003D214A22
MKNFIILSISTFLLSISSGKAQDNATQTIRGQIVDDITHAPIIGATIYILGSKPSVATSSDMNGSFTLSKVPVGQQSLRITFTGYEPQLINEILVTGGKETVLSILMTEKIGSLKEIIISAPSKRATNNDMITVSGRSFNIDDTKRYAGALGDPSRMVSSFAGVSSANDGRNDIIVRGNSPAGVLWQLEGIDIPNPNHYGSLSSTGGAVTLLNVNNLGKSDFLTGAFPAQFGNAISSVFDLRLRDGNTDKNEFLSQISFNGLELGAEGPLGKKGGSYVANYRYSSLALFKTLGFKLGTGTGVPRYQDLNFRVSMPLSAKNKVAVFGLVGPSSIDFLGNDVDTTNHKTTDGSENRNLRTKYFKAILGTTLETNFDDKTFGKLSVGYSNTSEKVSADSISSANHIAYPSMTTDYTTNTFSLVYKLMLKFDAQNNLTVGVDNNLYSFTLYSKRIFNSGTDEKTNIDQSGNTVLSQGYAELKHKFNNSFYINAGVHAQFLTLNHSSVIEPRLGLKYKLNDGNSLSLGYGVYSQAQNLLVYFNQQTGVNGNIDYTNKNLGFTKSQQLVAGYDYNINSSLHFKTEVYYQALTNVPVEIISSGYSVLNSGDTFGTDRKSNLINNGTGTNYGVEFTLEKYYNHGTYFLFTTSLFDSKYKGSDGIQRNTAYNSRYVVNLLAGKDFTVNAQKKDVLTLNLKLSTVGGKHTSPVDIAASKAYNDTRYDEINSPYSLQQKAYFRTDFKIGYRANRSKSTLEYGLDIQNITANKNIASQIYNRRTNTVNLQYQQGLLPVPYLRYTF